MEPGIRSAEALLLTEDEDKYTTLKKDSQYGYAKAILMAVKKMDDGELLMGVLRGNAEEAGGVEKSDTMPSNSSDV